MEHNHEPRRVSRDEKKRLETQSSEMQQYLHAYQQLKEDDVRRFFNYDEEGLSLKRVFVLLARLGHRVLPDRKKFDRSAGAKGIPKEAPFWTYKYSGNRLSHQRSRKTKRRRDGEAGADEDDPGRAAAAADGAAGASVSEDEDDQNADGGGGGVGNVIPGNGDQSRRFID